MHKMNTDVNARRGEKADRNSQREQSGNRSNNNVSSRYIVAPGNAIERLVRLNYVKAAC